MAIIVNLDVMLAHGGALRLTAPEGRFCLDGMNVIPWAR
jgi:hypothetical protein